MFDALKAVFQVGADIALIVFLSTLTSRLIVAGPRDTWHRLTHRPEGGSDE